jgi:hypothetical protein
LQKGFLGKDPIPIQGRSVKITAICKPVPNRKNMIAETLAGIALFKSAVSGIKSAIGTANDIRDIAGFIDALFEGEKQVQKERSKKSGVGIGDQFGVEVSSHRVINAKLAKEQMQEIASYG